MLDVRGASRLFPGHRARDRGADRGGRGGHAPAAATGLADWSALHQDQQRVGLVHAVCQGGAASLFLASLAARASGRPATGRALSAAGLALATIGAYLGGHVALRLGAGTSHANQVSHLSGLGWHDLCGLAEVPDRHPVRRQLGYLSLLVSGREPRSACCQTVAPISEDPCIRAGS